MSIFKQFDPKRMPKYKVELHLHLDGSYRPSTIWELAQKKGIYLGVSNFNDFLKALKITKPTTLADYLKRFEIYAPVVLGDLDAIERTAYELCEDQSAQGVAYFEARYSPHLLCQVPRWVKNTGITSDMVVERVSRGLMRGEQDFGVKNKSILCCIRGFPEWSEEVLRLCQDFKSQGVVGIDVAGDEALCLANEGDFEVFQKAAQLGIHRTVHAGEAGPSGNVKLAVDQMRAERIGHGYHTVDDEAIYKECLDRNIHFESCPYSSYKTGSVPLQTPKHPIIRFAEDEANFSISRDDPLITGTLLNDEYDLLRNLGLTDVHFARVNFNAARSCFLSPSEKQLLLEQLHHAYKVD